MAGNPSLLSLKMGVACALVLEFAACSSSPLVPTHDAGRDVVTAYDATSTNLKVDAVADAKHEAGPTDAAHVCPQALGATVCTSDAATSCRRTWAEVLATPSPWCGFGFWREFRGTCGGYNVDEVVNVDSGELYYYDAATGQLTAIYVFGNSPGSSCEFGPPDGIPCPLNWPTLDVDVCAQDAGTDAR